MNSPSSTAKFNFTNANDQFIGNNNNRISSDTNNFSFG